MDLTLTVPKEADFKMHLQLRRKLPAYLHKNTISRLTHLFVFLAVAGKIKLDVDVIKPLVEGPQITTSQVVEGVAVCEGVAKCPAGDKMRSETISEREREVPRSPLETQIGPEGAAPDSISAAPQIPNSRSTDRPAQISLNPLTLGGYLPADPQKLISERKSKSGQSVSADLEYFTARSHFSNADKTESGKKAVREPAKFTARLLDKSKHGGGNLFAVDDEQSLLTQAATGLFDTTDDSNHELDGINVSRAEKTDSRTAENQINDISPINFQDAREMTKREQSSDKRVLSDPPGKKKEPNRSAVSPNSSSQDDIITRKPDAPAGSSDIDHREDSLSEQRVAEASQDNASTRQSKKPAGAKQQISSSLNKQSGVLEPPPQNDNKAVKNVSKLQSENKKELSADGATVEEKLAGEKQEKTSDGENQPSSLAAEINHQSVEEFREAEEALDEFQAQREVEKFSDKNEAAGTISQSTSKIDAEEQKPLNSKKDHETNQAEAELPKVSSAEESDEAKKTPTLDTASERLQDNPDTKIDKSEAVHDTPQEEEEAPQPMPVKKAEQRDQKKTKGGQDDQNLPLDSTPVLKKADLLEENAEDKRKVATRPKRLDTDHTQSEEAKSISEEMGKAENDNSSIILDGGSPVKADMKVLKENTLPPELDSRPKEPEKSHSPLPVSPSTTAPTPDQTAKEPGSGAMAQEETSPEGEILPPRAKEETHSLDLRQVPVKNVPVESPADVALVSGNEIDAAKEAQQSLCEFEKLETSFKEMSKIYDEKVQVENLISTEEKKQASAVEEKEQEQNTSNEMELPSDINEVNEPSDLEEVDKNMGSIVEIAPSQQESLKDADGLQTELPEESEQHHRKEPQENIAPNTTSSGVRESLEIAEYEISDTSTAEDKVIGGQIEQKSQQATANYQHELTSEQSEKELDGEKSPTDALEKVDADKENKTSIEDLDPATIDETHKAKEKSADVKAAEKNNQNSTDGNFVEESKVDTTHEASSDRASAHSSEQKTISQKTPEDLEKQSDSSDKILIPSENEEISAEKPPNSPEPGVSQVPDRDLDDNTHTGDELPTEEHVSPPGVESTSPFYFFLWLMLTASQFLLYLKVAIYLYFLISVFYAKQIFLYSLTMVHIALHIIEEKRQKKPSAMTLFILAVAWFLAGLYIRYLVSVFDYVYSPFIYCYFKVITDYF